MRIAAISNSRIPSSTANSIQAMKMCDALVEIGHDVQLLVPAEAPDVAWEELAEQYGVKHHIPDLCIWHRDKCSDGSISSGMLMPPPDVSKRIWSTRGFRRARPLEAGCGRLCVLEMHADVAGAFGAWWLRQFWSGNRTRRLLVTTEALERGSGKVHAASDFRAPLCKLHQTGWTLTAMSVCLQPGEARSQLRLAEATTVGFTGHFYPGRGIDLLFELAKGSPI